MHVSRVPATSLPPGVVFDCDGTLADTESLSYRAWALTLADHGYTMRDEDFAAIVGRPFPHIWTYITGHVPLTDPARFRAEVHERYLASFVTDLEVHDDAVGAVRELAAAGVPIAVASSSQHESVLQVLARAGITDLIDVVIGADDVTSHKPEAEPYLVAAGRLGLEAHVCTAVEDTPVGVASAVAAGMFTVGILRAHNDRAQLSAASRVVDRITLESLVADPTAVARP